MATLNPFDLLGDDDSEDPSLLIAAQQQKLAPKKTTGPIQAQAQPTKPAKLPTKPLPPAQAAREARNDFARGAGRGGGRGYGRGRGGNGFSRDFAKEKSVSNNGFSGGQGAIEEPDAGKASERRSGYGGSRRPLRGGRHGSFGNGESEDGERPHRIFERQSGTGRGVTKEVVIEGEKSLGAEKPSEEQEAADAKKENPANEGEEKEPEDKEMTLEEYEKVLEEKRKALQPVKTEERKVDVDKEFKSMQQLASKKDNDDIFIKLGSNRDKRKEFSDKEEKLKKSVSINEFLKPAEGERYHNPGGRGRGRGRGSRGGGYGGSSTMSNVAAPKIEDPGQFPTLGAK